MDDETFGKICYAYEASGGENFYYAFTIFTAIVAPVYLEKIPPMMDQDMDRDVACSIAAKALGSEEEFLRIFHAFDEVVSLS